MSYELCNDVRYRQVLDEAVVVRQEAAEVIGLNEIGARILDLVKGGAAEAEIISGLAAEYEVDPAVLAGDVSEFLGELVRVGIVRRTGQA